MTGRGHRDGLYWPAKPDEDASPWARSSRPLGPAGYSPGHRMLKQQPYYGYYFRILTQQGQKAPAGR